MPLNRHQFLHKSESNSIIGGVGRNKAALSISRIEFGSSRKREENKIVTKILLQPQRLKFTF